jgi:hypothetical protein
LLGFRTERVSCNITICFWLSQSLWEICGNRNIQKSDENVVDRGRVCAAAKDGPKQKIENIVSFKNYLTKNRNDISNSPGRNEWYKYIVTKIAYLHQGIVPEQCTEPDGLGLEKYHFLNFWHAICLFKIFVFQYYTQGEGRTETSLYRF